MSFKDLYGGFIRSWECGQVKVLGRVSGVITLCLVVSTYLELKHVSLFWWQFCLLGLVLVCFILVTGWVYSRLNLFKLEQSAIQRHNPEMMEIKADVKRCLVLLGEK
jgi:hypothetical protein